MRQRLRRLMGSGQGRFASRTDRVEKPWDNETYPVSGDDEEDDHGSLLPEVEVESTSSGVLSYESVNDNDAGEPTVSNGARDAVVETLDATSNSHPQSTSLLLLSSSSKQGRTNRSTRKQDKDPYADVREQVEALAAQDKAQFATHTSGAATTHTHDVFSIPTFKAYCCYLSYGVLIILGHLRDFLAWVFHNGRYIASSSVFPSDDTTYYAPISKGWEHFFTRRLYHRIQDCFNRPIASNPGAHIHVLERVSYDHHKSMTLLNSLDQLDQDQQRQLYENGPYFTQETDGRVSRQCINLGSYNYLGFADDWKETCAREVCSTLETMPIGVASSRNEYGTSILHRELEKTVARFLGKEDALCLNMGFNTNVATIPALVGRGDLVVSDSLNHTSIVNGARRSGAAIRVFRHNDVANLEAILREAIVMGRPRTRRPWTKILVIVEGIYSMEGVYCDLKNVVRVCKKYGAYVYLDEAHSIGAMGPTGRGCAEYTGVDTADIDIMMGTFTKSFGAMGGYIAASKEVIAHLRNTCAASAYHNAMSPIVCQQILSAFKIIMGEDGTDIGQQKILALRDNANYFRMRLEQIGLRVLGRYDSPVIPVMLFCPTLIASFSHELLKRGVAVVVVGFPAVPLLLPRARFCISAGHTREDLDKALQAIDEVAELLELRHGPQV